MNPADLRRAILKSVHEAVKPLGFRKTDSVFSRKSHDVVHLVEVQGSRHNAGSTARFTVNLAVYVPDLIPSDVREFRKPTVAAAHWSKRIGSYCTEPRDQWWEVRSTESAAQAAQDISDRIVRHALPDLAALPNLAALVALWQTGKSPGITQKQCAEYLATLKCHELKQ